MATPTSRFGLCLLLGARTGAPALAHASSDKPPAKARESSDQLAPAVTPPSLARTKPFDRSWTLVSEHVSLPGELP